MVTPRKLTNMPATFVEIMKDLGNALEIRRTLTYDYEIISCVFDHQSLKPTEIFKYSTASSTAFFNFLKLLDATNIIYAEQNPIDKRSKIYFLSKSAFSEISNEWKGHNEVRIDSYYKINDAKAALHDFSSNIRGNLKISHLTCDYQILVFLYIKSGITNIQFTDLVDVSNTKFNSSLNKLKDLGLVYFERDHMDQRSKLYYISDHARELIDRVHADIFEWLDSRLPGLTTEANTEG